MTIHSHPCGWHWAYSESPETFHTFALAEDPNKLATDALLKRACFTDKRVLEIGCGTGRWSHELAQASQAKEWIATEPSQAMLRVAQAIPDRPNNLLFHQAKAQSIPLPADSFDFMFAGWVLGYLKTNVFEAALTEAQRLLTKSGEFWVLENGPTKCGVPKDGDTKALQQAGFQCVDSVQTTLSFESKQIGQQILDALFQPQTPPHVDAEGCVSHNISLWVWKP